MKPIAGIVTVKVDGSQLRVKSNVTYNLGFDKLEGIVGHDGVHGPKSTPQIPYIAFEMTDKADLSWKKLYGIRNATVTADLANGKTIVLRNSWNASDGEGNSEEANSSLRFEGTDAEEIIP